ncbi:MAG TPA: DUF6510 family protein [Chloroflexota bacterium]|jgi:hypothetical protein|nr:DUF6510 family protein [Chloroflexota bacterium]
MDADDLRLDGNALAGMLGELFGFEMTVTWGTCAGCGADNQLGAAVLYAHGMGAVLRCPGCDNPLIRIGHAAGRYWLDLRGMSCLRVDVPRP